MIDLGRKSVLGVNISAVDYEAAVARVVAAAQAGKRCAVSALAVHGVMTGALDEQQRTRLNSLDMLVPDGQPVRWALRILHGIRLADRVYGPELTLRVMAAASREKLPVFLYGSSGEVLENLSRRLLARFPDLEIAGAEPSRFGRISAAEQRVIAGRIKASGARIVFVGLGCPRQEVWLYEHLAYLPLPTLAVGAAFDFHAGSLPQAPAGMQRFGLEWLYRLLQEPRRLWRRYLKLNPLFLWYLCWQYLAGDVSREAAGVEPEHLGYA
ncbi:MAG TPA: WecB/TagA/CpsF family glycosyltransferase [Pseudohaliea sp.]|nr:WecB/TagA/CpsF family glycosyltransferase [Pseudohaliea sp.]